ncbi:hypothetical protein Nhal_0987 [Nitrosococcus halophilus Nc 4]|uniref:Uncharacterized protein n=1 Tax=Nitrosococcus halophilus (strain Nc4) TaxID=472759 RepID=D5BYU7_NITHN|nr:hypothetical protein [Nitrosococcus halophilus]ADE14160.1 hypothetical protein Nhal_0987 [Nitrosococcus halophilus Nc 4]
MSVKTTVFGGIHLSGEDAEKFERQVTYGRPKKAAKEGYERGKLLVEEYSKKGYSTITPRKK